MYNMNSKTCINTNEADYTGYTKTTNIKHIYKGE
jgi:hypothetical protein